VDYHWQFRKAAVALGMTVHRPYLRMTYGLHEPE
jgi:hypothetical protein